MPFRGSVYLKPVARTDEQRKTIYLTVAIVVAFLVHRLKVPIFVVVLWLKVLALHRGVTAVSRLPRLTILQHRPRALGRAQRLDVS